MKAKISIFFLTLAVLLWGCQSEKQIVSPTPPEESPTVSQLSLFKTSVEYKIIDLGLLGSVSGSSVYSMNDVGQMVGMRETSGGYSQAFLWENGVMTNIGTLGGASSYAFDINNVGQVVGESLTAANDGYHAFLWENGLWTDLGNLGGSYATAWGINEAGQVVLYGRNPWYYDAFLWDNGVFAEIGPNYVECYANDINNIGQIVGQCRSTERGRRAYLWEDGEITELGTLGGSSTAYRLNDVGQVVGWSEISGGGIQAFLWENGIMTNIGTLGGSESYAHGINNGGQIVGMSQTTEGDIHACLWENGMVTELGTLGGNKSGASDINNLGQIAGFSMTTEGDKHLCLWVPVQNVEIDIKPGSYPNSINLGSKGTIPVAIFSSETFDATNIDPSTISMADAAVKVKGNGTSMATSEDVNSDGLLDLVVHVETQGLNLTEGDTEVELIGQTFDGLEIRGIDTIRVVP
jgi:probable HAF family extracellular repeat protein